MTAMSNDDNNNDDGYDQSTVRVDRAMGDAAYNRGHRNRARG
jgi:hypothetical protein